MNLTPQDIELVATLRESAAFQKLLDILDASIEVVSGELLRSSGKTEKKLLAYWRALRHTYDVLAETPQSMQELLDIVPDEPLADEFKRDPSRLMEIERMLELERIHSQWLKLDEKSDEAESL